jgi:hypothetical protein
MIRLSPQEVEKRIQAWADVTILSLELKRATLRKRYPDLKDSELAQRVREELSLYGTEHDKR